MGSDSVQKKSLVRRINERRLRAATNFWKFSPRFLRFRLLPRWVYISLTANAGLAVVLLFLVLRSTGLSPTFSASASTQASAASTELPGEPESSVGGPRHQLTYQQWVDQLRREADVVADQKPIHLAVLAGDSISLWFPQALLPSGRVWLNQGISGETSTGLLRRLKLFDRTQPETIFVMIGINDLIRGVSDETIIANQQEIIRDLADTHPKAQIVLQSILPHAGEEATWEGRDRLLAVPNQRIQQLNKSLEELARQEGVYYLDLYPLFANSKGDLRSELSTDGLHLSSQGYQTWSIALQVYNREVLDPEATASAQ